VVWGLILLGLGTVVAGIIATTSPYWILLVGLLVLGAGLGLLSVPVSDTAVAGPPIALAGTASGVFKMSSMLGGALGVALFAAVGKAIGDHRAVDEARAAGLSDEKISQLSNSLSGSDAAQSILDTVPAAQRQTVIDAYHDAYATGVAGAIKVFGIVAILAALALLWIWPGRRRPETSTTATPETPEATITA
jgi:hypothetical protein